MAEHKDIPQEPAIEAGAAQTASVRDLPTVTAARSEQAHSRSHRFALLAASVALAAAFGAVIGSFGLTAAARLLPEPAKATTIDETHVLKTSIAQLGDELGALKVSVEAATKGASSQFGKISERIERAERAQGEPAARLAKIAESLDRLERRVTAAPAPASAPAPVVETTGSTPTPAPAASAESKAPAESKEAAKPSIVTGWIIRDVYRGRIALLENRYGVYEVEAGSNVPGVGRVESIKRQDGQWVVVTPKGLITSYR